MTIPEETRTPQPTEPKTVSFPAERGAVVKEWVKCGKPNCRCAKGKRHGPYSYHYVRGYVNGETRLLKRYVPSSEAPRLIATITDARERSRQQRIDFANADEVLKALFSGEPLTHERVHALQQKLYGRDITQN